MLNKVPEVTLYFWVIKVLCTTVGETASDYLAGNLSLGLTKTTFITGALLLVTLFFQFRLRRYVAGVYWLGIVLISVVGTQITDNLTDNLGVSLVTTTIVFSIVLAIVFAIWYAVRANAVDPHDLHDTPRGVLLARRPVHVRARHRGRRPDGRAAQRRLRVVARDLRRGDRARDPAPLPVQAQRRPRVLDRVHPHPAARRLDRRPALAAAPRRRARARHDRDERDLPRRDPRRRHVPQHHEARRDRDRGQPAARARAGARRRAQDGGDAGTARRDPRARALEAPRASISSSRIPPSTPRSPTPSATAHTRTASTSSSSPCR